MSTNNAPVGMRGWEKRVRGRRGIREDITPYSEAF